MVTGPVPVTNWSIFLPVTAKPLQKLSLYSFLVVSKVSRHLKTPIPQDWYTVKPVFHRPYIRGRGWLKARERALREFLWWFWTSWAYLTRPVPWFFTTSAMPHPWISMPQMRPSVDEYVKESMEVKSEFQKSNYVTSCPFKKHTSSACPVAILVSF